VRTDFQGGPDYAYSITLGANDGFLMSGISAPVVDGGPGAYQIALARYTSSGALDTTFGTAGKTLVALTAQSLQNANGHIVTANGIVVAATGKATVDGSTTDESNLLLVCP
jgi:hypothetical protein